MSTDRDRWKPTDKRTHARSPATSTHAAAACTQLSLHQPVQFSLRLSRDICCSCPTVLGGTPLGQQAPNTFLGLLCLWVFYRRYLWVSRHQTLSCGLTASGSLLFGRMHQRPPPLMTRQPLPLELSYGFPHQQQFILMPRQQPLLLEPQPSHGWSHLLVALPVPQDEPRNGPFITR